MTVIVPQLLTDYRRHTGPSANNFAIDGSTEYLCFVFQAPSSGPVLTKCAIRIGALTGSSPTYVVALEGVGADGLPDGTVKGGGSPVSVEITPDGGDAGLVKEYTFANSLDTTPGQLLALTIRPKSGTSIDASNNWSFTRIYTSGSLFKMPYHIYYNGSTALRAAVGHFGVSDGSSWWGYDVCQGAGNAEAYSSPVWAGNLFSVPADIAASVACSGACFGVGIISATCFRVALFGLDDTLLASTDLDEDVMNEHSATHLAQILWDDGPITLTCGTQYRLVAQGDDNTARIYYISYAAAAHMQTAGMLCDMQWTQGTTGAWANTATQRGVIFPIIDGITAPAGGGSHPFYGDFTGGL